MSLFHWFSKKKSHPATTVPPDSSGLAHVDATLPMRSAQDVRHKDVQGSAGNRKTERLERREMLYAIVRECMTRAGVLSASYKFKVLSLDSRGRQYLIMMDLPREHAGDTARLAEIEGLIAKAAKHSHDILVTAVYWRVNEHVTAGLTQGMTKPHLAASMREASPAAVAAATGGVTAHPLEQAAGKTHQLAATARPSESLFEPLQDDEVAAFKRALASSAPDQSESIGQVFQSGPRNPYPMPQFQDTEIDEMPLPLSTTQYGELK